MTKNITIADFLEEGEIEKCIALYREHGDGGRFVDAVVETVIGPVMGRINAKLGQENNARYLAYAVQYVMMQQRAP